MAAALLMPGEAIVPPAHAHIGAAINQGAGIAMSQEGGAIGRDFRMAAARSSPLAAATTRHVLDLTGDVKELLRFQRTETIPGSYF